AVILDTTEAQGQVVVTAAVDLADGDQVPPPALVPASDPELLAEVRRLLGVVHELVDDQWRRPRPQLRPDVARLHPALAAQGVEGVIAAALVRAAAERLEHSASIDDAVAAALATDAASAMAPRVRLFVGPPGDGKTTTIVKLAAQAERAGRRVALISAD